jgi:hypothetical protein
MMARDLQAFGTRLPEPLLRDLRVHCAVHGITQREAVETAVRNYLALYSAFLRTADER